MTRIVYISHAITSTDPVRQAKNLADSRAWAHRLMALGFLCYGPWNVLEAAPWATPEEAWEYAMEQCMPLVDLADAIFMAPGHDMSRGCKVEMNRAMNQDKPVFFTLQHLLEWKEQAA